MSEEDTDKCEMIFRPEYRGNRTISAGMYGNFTFSKGAEKILKDDRYFTVSQELADAIATPELCAEFREYVLTNLDFKVKELGFNKYLVDTAKRKTTKLLTVQLLDHDSLVEAVDGENLEKLAIEEASAISDNLHGGASKRESRIDGPRQMNR